MKLNKINLNGNVKIVSRRKLKKSENMLYAKKRKKQNTGEDEKIMTQKWILCPVCGSKTRDRLREDTVLINYPLFCPKCKNVSLIKVKELNVSLVREPDAKTQSR